MFLKILLPLFFFSGSFFLYGQPAWTIYSSTNSQLPQNTVRCIAVDGSNNKWIGTDYGLAKFNGSAWTNYNTSNSPLPDNNIRALAIDKNGAVWIGTLGGGVVKLYNNTWTIYNSSNSGLPGNFIRSISFDQAGNSWFGSSAGLIRFDGSTWTTWTNSSSPLISHHISAIAIGDDDTKYLGTINGGLVYMKDTTFTFYNLWNNTLPDNSILSVALDTAGNRWIGMPSGGVAVHYGGSVWQGFTMVNSQIQSDAINVVYIDTVNNVYFGSQDKGLILKKGFDFIHYDSLNSPMPDVNVLSIVKDKMGKLWLGTMYSGLVELDESRLSSISEPGKNDLSVNPTIIDRGQELSVVSGKSSTLEIYDMHGSLIVSRIIDKGRTIIPSSFTTSGIYLLRDLETRNSIKIVVR